VRVLRRAAVNIVQRKNVKKASLGELAAAI
jgi:hypothetical protein